MPGFITSQRATRVNSFCGMDVVEMETISQLINNAWRNVEKKLRIGRKGQNFKPQYKTTIKL